jgi:rubrerythrin
MERHWTLDDIPWDRFDKSKVNDDIVRVVRAASMVESNAADYATYLCNVFNGDPDFQVAARQWAREEVQHGVALGRWATLVDPEFDYDKRFAAFRAGYNIPVDVNSSVRGSRPGELIARCIVEVGTSSHYTAIADATDEPVLKEICRRIATDEWRHYGLFYRHLHRYLQQERLPRHKRAWIAFSRMLETEDDELRYAYHIANAPAIPAASFDRRKSGNEYAKRTYGLYNPSHIERAMGMVFKAVGFAPHGWASRLLTALIRYVMALRTMRWPGLSASGGV